LDSILKQQLGIQQGTDAELIRNGERKKIFKWNAYGGEAGDYGKKGKGDFWSTRAFNHFHNRLRIAYEKVSQDKTSGFQAGGLVYTG
jgi:hypothetical protein